MQSQNHIVFGPPKMVILGHFGVIVSPQWLNDLQRGVILKPLECSFMWLLQRKTVCVKVHGKLQLKVAVPHCSHLTGLKSRRPINENHNELNNKMKEDSHTFHKRIVWLWEEQTRHSFTRGFFGTRTMEPDKDHWKKSLSEHSTIGGH